MNPNLLTNAVQPNSFTLASLTDQISSTTRLFILLEIFIYPSINNLYAYNKFHTRYIHVQERYISLT